MYPSRDFRSLINTDFQAAIRAISREPFVEVLYFWQQSEKPKNKLDIYCRGIQEAIAKDRYPCILLDYVEKFPEFYSAVRDGLSGYWSNLRFSLALSDNPILYIDSILVEDINIDD